jgi:hypothetical protein
LDDNVKQKIFARSWPTEDAVEREYWRLAQDAYEDLEVLYGADLHTSTFGRFGGYFD